jgi:hypothetical protein
MDESLMATYSTLQVDVDTVFCLQEDQKLMLEPMEKQYPDIDQQVSRQFV